MQHGQTFCAGQGAGLGTDPLEAAANIGFNSFQTWAGFLDGISLHAHRDVLAFYKAVVAFFQLVFKHPGVLMANIVVAVAPVGNRNATPEILNVVGFVNKGQLHRNRAVKIVKEITIGAENLFLILRLGQTVIHILKLDGLGVVSIIHLAQPVPVHDFVWNGLLGAGGNFTVALGFSHSVGQTLFVAA